ncbi:MAG: helix-hairpin-helix domain-containing protein [Syntrophales bacterium]|nr:helix-hairpin-helix domain-containing protein [Syntrophales bacterium]MCK9528568.1 helix-hairpin-helix domain-containing protein [Syntrophales bacterium]MDX9922796.1 helix-hairpin-helix domain-containing protein [Syntrophales bacterium]
MRYSRSVFCLVVFVCFLALWAPMLAAKESGSPVNINTASATELATLKNIGPALSQRIIQHRENNGPFQRPEDIMNVPGIGRHVFETNIDRIQVDSE